MDTIDSILLVLLVAVLALQVVLLWSMKNRKTGGSSSEEVESLRQELFQMQEKLSAGTRESAGKLRQAMDDSQSRLRSELTGTVQNSLQSMGAVLNDGQRA